jgi:hypothetical protein
VVTTDQEYAALVREVLDPQRYPEIRESPGGPLDTPYDAAGWTLPMQMGVRTITVTTPLSADARAKMRMLGSAPEPAARPAPYNMDTRADAAAFDSATGIGFDSNPVARAIVPPAGRITGTGPALAVNPAENNAFRAINRAWRNGAAVLFDSASSRYVITGLTPAAQEDLVTSYAIRGERITATSAGTPRPRIGLFMANTSMDEGWTRWVLDAFEFEYVRVSGEDIQAGNLRSRVDVLLISDEARGVLWRRRRRGGRAGGARRPQCRPGSDARRAARQGDR